MKHTWYWPRLSPWRDIPACGDCCYQATGVVVRGSSAIYLCAEHYETEMDRLCTMRGGATGYYKRIRMTWAQLLRGSTCKPLHPIKAWRGRQERKRMKEILAKIFPCGIDCARH